MENQTNNLPYNTTFKKKQEVDLGYIVGKVLGNWYWFLLSLVLCLALTTIFVIYVSPNYNITAQVLVNGDQSKGITSGESETDILSSLGLFSTPTNVNNELEIISSRTLLEKTVHDLQLNVIYYGQGPVRYEETYTNSPFFIKILNLAPIVKPNFFGDNTSPVEYYMHINKDSVNFEDKNTDSVFNAKFGDTLRFKYGTWVLENNPAVVETDPKHDIGMRIYTYDYIYSLYSAIYTAILTNEDVTTIDMDLTSPVPKKGEDILNHIIQLYVKSDIDENNKIADSTIAFIDQRLIGVTRDLMGIESTIEQFKKQNNLASIPDQAKLLVDNTLTLNTQLAQQQVQIQVVKDLENYLEDEKNNQRIMPTTAPIQDPAFVASLEKYNALQIERQNNLLTSTENNPMIKGLDIQIEQQRGVLLKMLQSFENGLVVNKNDLTNRSGIVAGAIQKVPTQEKIYLDYSRQQDVLQQLYLYLLKTKEQTEVSKSDNIDPIRIINAPESDPLPYFPNKILFFLGAFIFGIMIPSMVLFVKELLRNKITVPEDITTVTNVPLVASISHTKSENPVVVTSTSRTAISEQFRALRTNLQFIANKATDKVILVTSSMSGEGKSFVAINLATTLGFSGKKVLLMEMDLRKPKLSANLGLDNNVGFTNYIVSDIKIDDIIKPSGINDNVWIISSGLIPPNPSEIILNEKVEKLFAEIRHNFDYIVIDTPPIGLVSDAILIGKYSDISMYVVRQKYTFKKQLEIVDDLYQNNKLKNLNIIFNDIKKVAGYEYGYGYGYGYSHGYYEKDLKEAEVK